jgi:oligopeptide/dipeptide ABC transporter ATP-binding protein
MYLGKIVELAESQQIYLDPRHPYTRTLLDAIPIADPDARPMPATSEPGKAKSSGEGCVFRPRCPYAKEKCDQQPPLTEISPGQFSACHFANELPEHTLKTG